MMMSEALARDLASARDEPAAVAASVAVLPPALGMQLPPLGSAMVSFCCGEGPSNQREPL